MGEAFLYCVCRRTHTHRHTLSHSHTHIRTGFFSHFSSLRFFARFSLFCGEPAPSLHCNYDCCMPPPSSLPATLCAHTFASLCGRLHAFFAHLMYFASFFPLLPPASFLSCIRRFFCLADAAVDVAVAAALLFFSRKLLKC